MRSRRWGGVFEPIEPPVEKPETPTTPPSTEDLLTIKIEDDIMAVVGTNTWNAIAYGNGKYVAVGAYGYTTTSIDGINWTEPVLAVTPKSGIYDITGFAYGNGIFVAACRIGVLTSRDGTTWTKTVISKTGCSWYSCIYANGMFVLGGVNSSGSGTNGFAATSTDGINWTLANEHPTNCIGMAYGNGIYIGVGSSYISRSTDCITWLIVVSDRTMAWNGAAYGNGKFVAVGPNGWIANSLDGKTWTDKEQVGTVSWHHVIYINDRFIAVSTSYYTTSVDGITWTPPTRIQDADGNDLSSIYGIVVMP